MHMETYMYILSMDYIKVVQNNCTYDLHTITVQGETNQEEGLLPLEKGNITGLLMIDLPLCDTCTWIVLYDRSKTVDLAETIDDVHTDEMLQVCM